MSCHQCPDHIVSRQEGGKGEGVPIAVVTGERTSMQVSQRSSQRVRERCVLPSTQVSCYAKATSIGRRFSEGGTHEETLRPQDLGRKVRENGGPRVKSTMVQDGGVDKRSTTGGWRQGSRRTVNDDWDLGSRQTVDNDWDLGSRQTVD